MVSIRMRPDEKNAIERAAYGAHKTMAEYLRDLGMDDANRRAAQREDPKQ